MKLNHKSILTYIKHLLHKFLISLIMRYQMGDGFSNLKRMQ